VRDCVTFNFNQSLNICTNNNAQNQILLTLLLACLLQFGAGIQCNAIHSLPAGKQVMSVTDARDTRILRFFAPRKLADRRGPKVQGPLLLPIKHREDRSNFGIAGRKNSPTSVQLLLLSMKYAAF